MNCIQLTVSLPLLLLWLIGARPAAPPIEGLEDTPYITYTEALRLTKARVSFITALSSIGR
jgi:hypothetical protein